MKIAVATKDGKKIASIRSSPMFRIYLIMDGKVQDNTTCENEYTYSYIHPDKPEHGNSEKPKSHTYSLKDNDRNYKHSTSVLSVVKELEDCGVVIFRNIGKEAWNTLGLLGKEMIMTDEREVEEAVKLYLNGKLVDKYSKYH